MIDRFEVKGKEQGQTVTGSLDVNREGELELSIKYEDTWYALAKLSRGGELTVFGGVPYSVINTVDVTDCDHHVGLVSNLSKADYGVNREPQ